MSKYTEKYISGIKERTQKKIDTLRNQANEEYMNWADTGYQRYMSKNERLLAEADELEAFIKPHLNDGYYKAKIRELENQNERLTLLLKQVDNVVNEEMKFDFPDCHATRRLEDIVSRFKFG